MSYSEIQGELNSERLASLPPLYIAILRNIVIEPMEPYLRYLAYQVGCNVRCEFSEYDNVFQEAVGGQKGILNEHTDCVLLFLKLENLSWDLARNFASLSAERIEGEKDRIKNFIASVLTGIRKQTAALILWNDFELPLNPSLGIVDYQQSSGQTACVTELNQFLRDALRAHKNAYLLDLNVCLARVGAKNFYDPRYWHMGKAPYSLEALEEISSEAFKYIRPLKGKNRKCLVLDCDNVLWGGIVGEDGLAGIKLGKTYPGSAYYEFQQEILNLYHRGVVLALCSKNNEEDVWEVFQQHPDMLLRKEHLAAAQLNWRDKVTNLRQIAADLNLGLESFVFVDDSPYEAGQVCQYLPEVEVIQLPQDRAVEYREILAAGGWFDTLTLSEEDRQRGAMYRAEAARKDLQMQSQDLASYYTSLEMVLEVRFADPFSIPRIAQLTQKTNQFTLTTRRYSDAQIQELSQSDSADVIHVQLKDRFGESGLTGVCILRFEGNRALIDSFLLSCRVLGRGVEDAFLAQCMKWAKRKGCTSAVGEYRPTAKNGQVKDFYSKQGFKWVATVDGTYRFELDLHAFRGKEPRFFKQIDSELVNDQQMETTPDGAKRT
jgi:FkbH-like protein